jgi:hypothetical protein
MSSRPHEQQAGAMLADSGRKGQDGGMAGELTAVSRESVSGPWRELFIAAYTACLDGLFYGYGKIFLTRPEDAWMPGALAKIGTDHGYGDEDSAMRAIESRTHEVVEDMHDVLKSIAIFRPPR